MDGGAEHEDNKIWQLVMSLKIVALVMAPGYTDVGRGYRFLGLFLCDAPTPKHYFYIIRIFAL